MASSAWSYPDGKRLLTAAVDNSARIWDVATGACLRIHAFGPGGFAVWNPNDNKLIEARGDAWRWMYWRRRGVEGIEGLLPLEAAGDVCKPL